MTRDLKALVMALRAKLAEAKDFPTADAIRILIAGAVNALPTLLDALEAREEELGVKDMRIESHFVRLGRLECEHDEALALAGRLRKALVPFAAFAAAFDAKPLSGLHNELYGIHAGTEWAAVLRLSDCRTANALLADPAVERLK